MSQLARYGPLMAPPGPFSPGPRAAGYAIPLAAERSAPTLVAFIACIYLCSVPLLSSWREETSWIPQAIAVGVAAGWLVFGLVLSGRPVIWAAPILLYLAWTAWCATGLMVTLSTEFFMSGWTRILKVAGITWVISQCVRTRSDLLMCFTLLGLISLVVFVTGADTIKEAASFSGTRETVGARAGGTLLTNANDLGVFGVVVLMGALTGLWAYRSTFLKAVCMAPVPIALYLIAASGSRMCMIAVMMAAVGMYFFHLRRLGSGGVERKIAMLLLGVMVAGGSIYYVSKNPFFFRLQAAFADTGAVQEQPRTQYFFAGVKAAVENPVFGLGIGGFALHGLGAKGNKLLYSHSTVTETLSCTGFPGFAIYFGAQFALFKLIRKVRRADLPKWDAAAVNMILVMFWTLMLMSVVSVMMADRLIWPLTGAFCGYLVTLRKRYVDSPPAGGSFAA